MLPFGMIEPDVQPFTALLAFGQMLDQKAASDTAAILVGDTNPDRRRYLFRLDK